MVAGQIFLAHHGDVVVGAVHSGAHQVGRRRVKADIFFINMLFMDRGCDEAAVRAEHIAPQFGVYLDVAHAVRGQDLLVGLPHALADGFDIARLLLGEIGDTDAARQIDKGDMRARLVFQLHRHFKTGSLTVWDSIRSTACLKIKRRGCQNPLPLLTLAF